MAGRRHPKWAMEGPLRLSAGRGCGEPGLRDAGPRTTRLGGGERRNGPELVIVEAAYSDSFQFTVTSKRQPILVLLFSVLFGQQMNILAHRPEIGQRGKREARFFPRLVAFKPGECGVKA